MPVATHSWKAGDTELIEADLRDRGKPLPLVPGTIIKFHARDVGGGTTNVVNCEIVNYAKATVQFVPPSIFDTPSIYLTEWEVTYPDGTQITVPNGNGGDAYDTFEVRAGLA